MNKDRIFAFPPSAEPDAEILILGSMPGVESLKQQQYYAFPANAFWNIMAKLYGFSYGLPYERRLALLCENKIALWDSVHSCIRPGSMDADIRYEEANDFETFFLEHGNIRKIVFNGQTSFRLFKKHTKKMNIPDLEIAVAPSTSPAYASISFDEKLILWKNMLNI